MFIFASRKRENNYILSPINLNLLQKYTLFRKQPNKIPIFFIKI